MDLVFSLARKLTYTVRVYTTVYSRVTVHRRIYSESNINTATINLPFFLTICEGVTAGKDSEVFGEIVCNVRGTMGFNHGCLRASSGVHLTAGSHSRHFFKKSIN